MISYGDRLLNYLIPYAKSLGVKAVLFLDGDDPAMKDAKFAANWQPGMMNTGEPENEWETSDWKDIWGCYSPSTKIIAIRSDRTAEEQARTLAHEIVHHEEPYLPHEEPLFGHYRDLLLAKARRAIDESDRNIL